MRQARILAQATSDLVNAIKADAEGETDLENSRKLLSAAKLLADATARMVEAAKVGQKTLRVCFRLDRCALRAEWLLCVCRQGAAANPDSEEQQQKLREAAEGLRMATNAAAQNAIKKRLVNKLEVRTEPHKAKPSRTQRCDDTFSLLKIMNSRSVANYSISFLP